MAKKIYELNNIVVNASRMTDKYNVDTTGYKAESFEIPLSVGVISKIRIGRPDIDSCTEAYSEIRDINRV